MDTRPIEPDAESLARMKEGQLYWSAVAPIWERVTFPRDPEAFLAQFAQVTEAQGLLLAARWCVSEVSNGGLHQFFLNPTGVLAPEAVCGFTLIGIPSAAAVVASAMSKFGAPYPRDHTVRNEHLHRLCRPGASRADWNPFHRLDESFQAATFDFTPHADAFVRSHLSQFFRSAGWRFFYTPTAAHLLFEWRQTASSFRSGAPIPRTYRLSVHDARLSPRATSQHSLTSCSRTVFPPRHATIVREKLMGPRPNVRVSDVPPHAAEATDT